MIDPNSLPFLHVQAHPQPAFTLVNPWAALEGT